MSAVRERLVVGVGAVGAAVICLVLSVTAVSSHFAAAGLAAFAFTALALATASLLGARREEFVHRLANSMDQAPLLESHGEDGTPDRC